MSTMVQIRNMPDDVHRTLKSRAALAGLSLSDYLLRHMREVASRPTREEMMARLRALPPVLVSETPADAIRAEREER